MLEVEGQMMKVWKREQDVLHGVWSEDLHSVKSSFGKKAKVEKKNEDKPHVLILSCSPKAGRSGACLYAHKRVCVSRPG